MTKPTDSPTTTKADNAAPAASAANSNEVTCSTTNMDNDLAATAGNANSKHSLEESSLKEAATTAAVVVKAESEPAVVPTAEELETALVPTITAADIAAVPNVVEIAMSKATEDAVALAAMQEAATIVMEAQKRQAEDEHPIGARPPPFKKRSTPTRVSWDARLEQLSSYKNQHGNLLIPIRYKLNPSLGKFVHNTREQYKLFHKQTPEGYKKKCSLTAERIGQLEELGFAWTTQRIKLQNEDWTTRLKQLEAFKAKNTHCLVPHGYSEDPSFAEWIHRQRTTYASLMKSTHKNLLVEQRMNQLKDLGFNFTVHSDKWLDHWNQLKAYNKKHGDCQVPTHFAENPKLGRWVHTQRHQRRLQLKEKKSCMTQERIDQLDELGFSWEVRPSLERPRATWQQRLEELTEFKEKNAHFKVDSSVMPQLHAWCHEQRQRLKLLAKNNGKDVTKRMSPERFLALTAIGFDMDTELLEPEADAKDDTKRAETSGTDKVSEKEASVDKDKTTKASDKEQEKEGPKSDDKEEAPKAFKNGSNLGQIGETSVV